MGYALASLEFSQANRVRRPFGSLVDLVEEGRLGFRHTSTLTPAGSDGERPASGPERASRYKPYASRRASA